MNSVSTSNFKNVRSTDYQAYDRLDQTATMTQSRLYNRTPTKKLLDQLGLLNMVVSSQNVDCGDLKQVITL